ncbi:Predicted transcriptional regulator YdeE, contains AraC-type DNA-binding domain [Duganella sacchari]|uniref:Predicted transcriptional regulator YdeE, contains AraC-type DNA-binding domain n=1 Tax=Duganella sacchari TaxID=551987 RepID=A0A1M7KXF5_9BURK|nr:GyrI-like domain-containing protein [Duganella sacchari]SHM70289.1 Predicted transcriptional regulator YdeE, contains AraC-type DNA-binding domain [Duganella sacchari]
MTMHYDLVTMEPVTIAGITLRTDNSEAGMQKIQQHWGQFFQQGVTAKVARAVDPAIYEAYFDYESDANGAYTLMLGNRVPSGEDVPAGLHQVTLPAATYAKFTIDDPRAIRQAWEHIWSRADLQRTYSGDFEVIGEKSADIYVAVQQ